MLGSTLVLPIRHQLSRFGYYDRRTWTINIAYDGNAMGA